MRIAVISDIHGNATAFRQVLEDIEVCAANRIFCLGDNIGYGPEPDAVARILRQRNIASVIGNHELALRDPVFLRWFNPAARTSLEKTMGILSPEATKYLTGLPPFIVSCNCRFVHGFPPDSPTSYLFEMHPADIEKEMAQMKETTCFIGHTHELGVISFNDGKTEAVPVTGGETLFLDPAAKHIVNAGSVGQPRDGSSLAKYVLFDTEKYRLEVRSIPYDVDDTISKIYSAGLPNEHALRLL